MPTFTSDLTTKTFPGSQYKEFSVPDASQSTPDYQEIEELRKSRGLPPLDEQTKRAMYASQMQQQSEMHNVEQVKQEMDELKKAKFDPHSHLSPAAKKRIETLCGMSRGTREVDIDGNKYLLRTIKGKEHRAAIVAATQFDGTPHAAFEIRKQLLARSIVQIGEYDLGLFLGDESPEARLEFVDELEEPTLIKLYSEYLDLAQTTQNKYFIKTTEEAKEVMEDIKK